MALQLAAQASTDIAQLSPPEITAIYRLNGSLQPSPYMAMRCAIRDAEQRALAKQEIDLRAGDGEALVSEASQSLGCMAAHA